MVPSKVKHNTAGCEYCVSDNYQCLSLTAQLSEPRQFLVSLSALLISPVQFQKTKHYYLNSPLKV